MLEKKVIFPFLENCFSHEFLKIWNFLRQRRLFRNRQFLTPKSEGTAVADQEFIVVTKIWQKIGQNKLIKQCGTFSLLIAENLDTNNVCGATEVLLWFGGNIKHKQSNKSVSMPFSQTNLKKFSKQFQAFKNITNKYVNFQDEISALVGPCHFFQI